MKKLIIGMTIGFTVLLALVVVMYFTVFDKQEYDEAVGGYNQAMQELQEEYGTSQYTDDGRVIKQEYDYQEDGTLTLEEIESTAIGIPEEEAIEEYKEENFENIGPTPIYEHMVHTPEPWVWVARAAIDCQGRKGVQIGDELDKIKEFLTPRFYQELNALAMQLDNKTELATPEEEIIEERDEAKVKIFNEAGYVTDVLYYSDYVALYGEPEKEQIIGYDKYFGDSEAGKEEELAYIQYVGTYTVHLVSYVCGTEQSMYMYTLDSETGLIDGVVKKEF